MLSKFSLALSLFSVLSLSQQCKEQLRARERCLLILDESRGVVRVTFTWLDDHIHTQHGSRDGIAFIYVCMYI